VTARLLPQARLCFEDVTVRGPAVRGAARHFALAEVHGGGATMTGGKLELGGRVLVELCLGGELLAQFQTFTSR
jgi:hypothetical protein